MEYQKKLLDILDGSTRYDIWQKWRDLCKVINEISEKANSTFIEEIIDFLIPVLDEKLSMDCRMLPWKWVGTPMEVLGRVRSLISFNDYINGNKNPFIDPAFENLSEDDQTVHIEAYYGKDYQVGIITAFDITYSGNACALVVELESGTNLVLKHDFASDFTTTILEKDSSFNRIEISHGGRYVAVISESEVLLFDEDCNIFTHNFEERIEHDIFTQYEPEYIFGFCSHEAFFIFFHQKEGILTVVDLPGGEVHLREYDSIIWSMDIMSISLLDEEITKDEKDRSVIVIADTGGLLNPETLEHLTEFSEKCRQKGLWFGGPGSYNVVMTRCHPDLPLIGFFEPFEQYLYDNNNQTALYGGITFYQKVNGQWQPWDHLFYEEILDSKNNALVVRKGGITASYSLKSGEMVIVEFPEKRVTTLKTKIDSVVWKFGSEAGTIIFPDCDGLKTLNYHTPGESLTENRHGEVLNEARRIINDGLRGVAFDYLSAHLDSITVLQILAEVIEAIGPAVEKAAADDRLPRSHWENDNPRMKLCTFRWVDHFTRSFPWQYSEPYIIELENRWIIIHGLNQMVITSVNRTNYEEKELYRCDEDIKAFSHAVSSDHLSIAIFCREKYHHEQAERFLLFHNEKLIYIDDDINCDKDYLYPNGLTTITNNHSYYWLANKGILRKVNCITGEIEEQREHNNIFSMALQPDTNNLLLHDSGGYHLYDNGLKKSIELVLPCDAGKVVASTICFTGNGTSLVTALLVDCDDDETVEKPKNIHNEPITHRYIINHWKVPKAFDFASSGVVLESQDYLVSNLMENTKYKQVQHIMRQGDNYVDMFFRDTTALTFNVLRFPGKQSWSFWAFHVEYLNFAHNTETLILRSSNRIFYWNYCKNQQNE
ncbi:hypothetical protein [Vallitalea maricola]|uniref:Uncharacterized protein n=1 Tax=Vallitalea maricola TaxID=3074433 RepID=A0ACB5ULI1_9FIRM|nr:hypothetical protein AN2V17_30730 [Vallitalea sp. AN17-2]